MPTFPDLRPDHAAQADPAAVRYLQSALLSQGYHGLTLNGKYDKATIAEVQNFQAARLGPNGKFLKPDGWVGPSTWWAVQNPSGPAQASHLAGVLPKGLSAARRAILQAAAKDHANGTHEVPDGANYGDGVTRILAGVGPCPWCCYSVSQWHKDGTAKWPFDTRFGLVKALWDHAVKKGRAYKKGTKDPVPGDAFVLLYRDSKGQLTGLGHTGLVGAVSEARGEDCVYNTFEGNAGNRVKRGQRDVQEVVLEGFVDMVGDADVVRLQFARGLFSKKDNIDSSVAGTR